MVHLSEEHRANISAGLLARSPWTHAKREKLRKLWSRGHSASRIADALGGGITRNMVIGKAWRLELPQRPTADWTWTDNELATLRSMRAGGKSYKAIAAATGRSERAVNDKARRLGITKKRRAA